MNDKIELICAVVATIVFMGIIDKINALRKSEAVMKIIQESTTCFRRYVRVLKKFSGLMEQCDVGSEKYIKEIVDISGWIRGTDRSFQPISMILTKSNSTNLILQNKVAINHELTGIEASLTLLEASADILEKKMKSESDEKGDDKE